MTAAACRTRLHAHAMTVLAISLGAAVPLLFAGRAAEGIALGIAAGAAIVAWFAAPPDKRPSPLIRFWTPARAPAAFAIAVMFAFWSVSALDTIDPVRSPLAWLLTAGLIIGSVLLRRLLMTGPRTGALTYRTLIITALAGVVFSLVAAQVWPDLLGYLRKGRPITALEARGTLKAYGSVLPCLIPVVVWAGFRLGGRWRIPVLVFVPFALLAVLTVGSRAGLLGLGCAAVAMGLLWLLVSLPRQAALWAAAFLIFAGVAVTATVASRLPDPPYQGRAQLRLPTWMVDEHRQVIWGFAVHRGLDRPWFGYGLKTGGRVPGAKVVLPRLNQEYIPSHPHNWIFQLFLETGIFGVLGALAALVLFLRNLVRAAAQGQRAAWASFALAAAFFGSTLVNFSIWQAWWQAVYFILTAIVLTAVRWEPEDRQVRF